MRISDWSSDVCSSDLEVDVIVPPCLKRSPPYDPVVYSHQNEKGEYVGYNDLPEHGLVPVHAAGTAGMLIRRPVLDEFRTEARRVGKVCGSTLRSWWSPEPSKTKW